MQVNKSNIKHLLYDFPFLDYRPLLLTSTYSAEYFSFCYDVDGDSQSCYRLGMNVYGG